MNKFIHRKKNSIIVLYIVWLTHIASTNATPHVRKVSYRTAGVLPTFTVQKHRRSSNTCYVIVGRESTGIDQGTYDAFCSTRTWMEHDPVSTAARACNELLLTNQTIGKTITDMGQVIDPEHCNAVNVVVRTKARVVLFIVEFDEFVRSLRNSFYHERASATALKNKRKDRLAFVEWNDLVEAINDNCAEVSALIVNPKSLKLERCIITLRPLFRQTLSPYVSDEYATKGLYKNVYFYP
jgi:hypothetical protein